MITLDLNHAFLKEDVKSYQDQVRAIDEALQNGTCKGNDFIGWLNWANNYDKDEFSRIKEVAAKVRENTEVFVVCGIGGSYLGARAAIEMMNGYMVTRSLKLFIWETLSHLLIFHRL